MSNEMYDLETGNVWDRAEKGLLADMGNLNPSSEEYRDIETALRALRELGRIHEQQPQPSQRMAATGGLFGARRK